MKGVGYIGCYVKVKLAKNVKSLTLSWTNYHSLMPPAPAPLKCKYDEDTAAGDTIFNRTDIISSDTFRELGKTQSIMYPVDVHIDVLDIEYY